MKRFNVRKVAVLGAGVMGAQIAAHLVNVKANDDKTAYEGGDILDPNNGKVYRVRLRPFDDGKKLEVRGYLGPFYRNQTWLRVE